MSPVIAPRNQGEPRPVSEPSSDCDSENPIEIPAPTDAASPTRKAFQLFWKAKAAATAARELRSTHPSDQGVQAAQPAAKTISDVIHLLWLSRWREDVF